MKNTKNLERKSSADRITCFLPLYYNPLTTPCYFSNFCNLLCNSNIIHIFQCNADAAFLIVGLKSSENIHGKALPEALFFLYIAELSPSTTIHWISRYTRNREYFGTRWKRGKVLCVYSKHNNGKARSREEHGASPSLWKVLPENKTNYSSWFWHSHLKFQK